MIWTLAKKELRLLLRDPKAAIILLVMPFMFILVLGLSLGEGFGQKPDDRLRVSLVDLDEGPPRNSRDWFPRESWAKVVQRDLAATAEIRVEIIPSLAEAEDLVRNGKRAAVLVFGPRFSRRVSRCSFLAGGQQDLLTLSSCFPRPGLPVNLALAGLFNEAQDALPLYLADGINPFYRDGVRLEQLDMRVLRDPTQQTAASIIEQVAQGTLLRVILPWMIGRAFEKIGDPAFLEILGREKQLPGTVKFFLTSPLVPAKEKKALGVGLQSALQNLFPKYKLTAKTWDALTKSEPHTGKGVAAEQYQSQEGSGLLKRGALRYQLLVPSYTVMFAFFLVLTVGWLFVAERRQGTLKRLRAAPLTRAQILLGKFLPCFLLSVAQGLFLMAAGKLVFGMSWGPQPLWLLLVVFTTSLAAMGLALLVATLARTETQVAIYGTLLVLVLAGVSGCLMGDRAMMPERMQEISLVTPHAWALEAYRELLTNPAPNYERIGRACGVLTAFGLGFVLLAWGALRLD
jgi:ABC-type multidrug transport system permease subunit